MAGLKGRKFKRDRFGRFSAVNIAGGERTPSRATRHRRGIAEHKHGVLTPMGVGGARKKLTRWSPGIRVNDEGEELYRGRRVERYDRGLRGPDVPSPGGGVYETMTRLAGWKLTGITRRR